MDKIFTERLSESEINNVRRVLVNVNKQTKIIMTQMRN